MKAQKRLVISRETVKNLKVRSSLRTGAPASGPCSSLVPVSEGANTCQDPPIPTASGSR
jgi:hypothetical protein